MIWRNCRCTGAIKISVGRVALQRDRVRGKGERGTGRARNLLKDNEAAHEYRHEWVLFTIANSGSSGLPGCATYVSNTVIAAIQRLLRMRKKSRGQSVGVALNSRGAIASLSSDTFF